MSSDYGIYLFLYRIMKILWSLILSGVLANVAIAQISLPIKVEATFSIRSWSRNLPRGFEVERGVSNPDFSGPVSGSFSYILDVPQLGGFTFDDATPDSVLITPSRFGSTIFSAANLGFDIFFNDGQFVGLILGGTEDGVNSLSADNPATPNKPSDIFMTLFVPNFNFFFYQIDGLSNSYFSDDIAWTVSVTQVSDTPVPEPASYGVCAGLLIGGVILARRKAR